MEVLAGALKNAHSLHYYDCLFDKHLIRINTLITVENNGIFAANLMGMSTVASCGSVRLEIEGSLARDSQEALRCVLGLDTLSFA